MIRSSRLMGAVVFVLAMLAPAASASGRQPVAIFNFELIDMSLDGEFMGVKSVERARLGLLSERLRKWFAASGYRLSDMGPVAAEAEAAHLQACGCMQRLASRVGAELAVIGVVKKISNLILNITITVIDVRTNAPVALVTADIRSNTDQSWTRGLDWLIRYRLTGALSKL